jgi:hypothetical protein
MIAWLNGSAPEKPKRWSPSRIRRCWASCTRRSEGRRTRTEGAYELYDGDLEFPSLNQAFLAWEHIYNTARPRRSLDGRTPNGYLQLCHPDPFLDHLSLM